MTQFSWYSLVGQGATRELLFWVWGMYDRLCTGGVADGTRVFFLLYAAWVRSRAERPSVSYTKVVMEVAWTGHNLQKTKTN